MYEYHGALFDLREEHADTCYNTDGLYNIVLSETCQTQKDKYWMMPRRRGTQRGQVHREKQVVAAGLWNWNFTV